MEHITVKEILEATGGRLLCGTADTPLVHISIDSRTMKGDDLFVPLIGEKVDAHRFIEGAFQAGAAAVLTSEHDQMEDSHPWIRVEDTKQALQAIGSYYRKRLSLPLVGITGSVGKTTTREMIGAALSAGFRVYKTPGNCNSQVGLPITLTEITETDEIGVLELGMSEPGELTVIAKIANVDMAVITNIGVTHIEQLGSKEQIYKEKLSIQDGLKKGGVLLLNGDDELLMHTTARPGYRTIMYGTGANCDYRATDLHSEDGYPAFTAVCGGKTVPVRLRVLGKHQVINAMAALAVADLNGVALEQAAEALSVYDGFEGRQKLYRSGSVTVIDDSYNASPVSMKAGIQVLSSIENCERRIAVLADMKELGSETGGFHREIGVFLKDTPTDVLLTCGAQAALIGEEMKAVGGLASWEGFGPEEEERLRLLSRLKELIMLGDCVLFKGSNSMKLGETAAELLKFLEQRQKGMD